MFFFNKKPSPEELEAREANKEILSRFQVTAAWGVKRERTATQFVYDEDMKAFCIVGGPVEEDGAWKEENPWVIRFDQVTDVCLYVDQWWSENNDKYDHYHNGKVLKIDQYDEVFWKYDFDMRFRTTHPYAKKLEYQMNYYTNIFMIPGKHIFARRGMDLSGEYRGKEIREKRLVLEKYAESLKDNVELSTIVDSLFGDRPKSIAARLRQDVSNDWYISRVENAVKHLKRAERITRLIEKNRE